MFRSTLEPYNSKPTGDITAVTKLPAGTFTDRAQAHRTELLSPATGEDHAGVTSVATART